MDVEYKDNLISNEQVESFAYAIYEDIDKYVDTTTEEYNNWLLNEIVVDALKDIGCKRLKNEYD